VYRIGYCYLNISFLFIVDIIDMLNTIRYAGNNISVSSCDDNAKKAELALIIPVRYGVIDSLSGLDRDLRNVGIHAKKSLHIANSVAIKGVLVIYRPHKANKENNQQT